MTPLGGFAVKGTVSSMCGHSRLVSPKPIQISERNALGTVNRFTTGLDSCYKLRPATKACMFFCNHFRVTAPELLYREIKLEPHSESGHPQLEVISQPVLLVE